MGVVMICITGPVDDEKREPFDYGAAPNVEAAIALIDKRYRNTDDFLQGDPDVPQVVPFDQTDRQVCPYIEDTEALLGNPDTDYSGVFGVELPGWRYTITAPFVEAFYDSPSVESWVILPIAQWRLS